MCERTHTCLFTNVRLRVCPFVQAKPSIRQIMIHHDNGALMAAVKIIFDPPALSWPLSFLFVFSISCTSISPLSHNSLCHSLWDRERLQHAGLGRHNPDKNPPCRTSPNLTHEPTTHIYWARTTSDPIWSLSSRIWPILALSFRGAGPNRAEDGRQERLSLPGYLTPFIFVFVFFSGRLQRSGTAITFQVPANTSGT